METKVSVWKANLTNGVILGLIGVIYTLVMYFLDLTLNKSMGFLFLGLMVFILFFMIRSYRDNYLQGYITFGQSVGAGVVLFLYYSVISAIFTYILYKFIDSGLTGKQLAMIEETLLERGLPQEAVDAGMAVQKKILIPEIMAPFSIINNMIFGTVISLLVSIFTRKEGNPLVEPPVR